MPTLTFYPIGNADCCLIDLDSGEKLLFDYGNMSVPDDPSDQRCDLKELLRKDLDASGRNHYEVVTFTHLDRDHFAGFSEFFYLEHAAKYQDDKRARIDTLWVPAGVITEEGCEDAEGRVLQAEARHRLKKGEGIRVFSRPDALKEWLEDNGLTLEARKDLITDAGQIVPGFNVKDHGLEFFSHSPFAWRQDDGSLEDRNTHSIVVQAVFGEGECETKIILSGDADHEALTAIAENTKRHNNDVRLEWDVVNLPHHCSYLSLGPEKGAEKTEPVPEVRWLFEEQGRDRGTIISTSDPIPATDETQPPHRQAANYYKEMIAEKSGEFIVTMEHPSKASPEPLVISIQCSGAKVEKRFVGAAVSAASQRSPRAG